MVLSREWWDYHLTKSNGWVKGSYKLDFGGKKERAIPEDRALTIRYTEEIPYVYQKCKCTTTVVWSSKDKNEIQELKEKYGNLPSGVKDEEKG
ncbi:hypothetical protein ACFL5K_01355 [Gemmatimonadota bacterium]